MTDDIKLCECGCGQQTTINQNSNLPNKWRHGHSGRIHTYIPDGAVKQCSCGCGTEIPAKDKKGRPKNYVKGHYMNGRLLPKEVRIKISNAHIGKPLTPDHRKKLSIANKGRHVSSEHRLKLSIALKNNPNNNSGKSATDETKLKMSIAHKGRIVSESTRKKLSDAQKGDKNYNWQGGISFDPYCPKFNDSFKESIREQFDRECLLCGKLESEEDRKLSVHHVNYDKTCLCESILCKFVPLCRSCHGKTNHNKNHWEQLIINKLLEDICQPKKRNPQAKS